MYNQTPSFWTLLQNIGSHIIWDKWTLIVVVIALMAAMGPGVGQQIGAWRSQSGTRDGQAERASIGAANTAVGIMLLSIPKLTSWLPSDLPWLGPSIAVWLIIWGAWSFKEGRRRSAGMPDRLQTHSGWTHVIVGAGIWFVSFYWLPQWVFPYVWVPVVWCGTVGITTLFNNRSNTGRPGSHDFDLDRLLTEQAHGDADFDRNLNAPRPGGPSRPAPPPSPSPSPSSPPLSKAQSELKRLIRQRALERGRK